MYQDEDYQSGQEVGRRPDGSAIDCPFLPAVDQGRRTEWLRGFASVRDEVATMNVDLPPSDQQDRHAG